jgi:hypothetical protein
LIEAVPKTVTFPEMIAEDAVKAPVKFNEPVIEAEVLTTNPLEGEIEAVADPDAI